MVKERKINVLSLFDGISCGQFVLRHNLKLDVNYYASEIEKSAIQCTMANWPDTIQLGDVTKINYDKLPKIDLLIGGSPCQGFSVAGKGLAFQDERSKLFFEYVKAWRYIRKKNPGAYFLLENVKMKRQHEMVISKYMEVPALYIDSALFSAQSRKRLYWTNIPIDKLPEKECDLKLIDVVEEPYYKGQITEKLFHYARMNYNSLGWKQGTTIANMQGKSVTLTKSENRINIPIAYSNARKAFSVELERLAGLSDDYTKPCGSNKNRSAALGNGWECNTITFLLRNLKKLL